MRNTPRRMTGVSRKRSHSVEPLFRSQAPATRIGIESRKVTMLRMPIRLLLKRNAIGERREKVGLVNDVVSSPPRCSSFPSVRVSCFFLYAYRFSIGNKC